MLSFRLWCVCFLVCLCFRIVFDKKTKKQILNFHARGRPPHASNSARKPRSPQKLRGDTGGAAALDPRALGTPGTAVPLRHHHNRCLLATKRGGAEQPVRQRRRARKPNPPDHRPCRWKVWLPVPGRGSLAQKKKSPQDSSQVFGRPEYSSVLRIPR